MSTEYIHIRHYESLLGEMILGSFHDKICLCDWTHSKHRNRNDARICKALNAVYQEGSSPIHENQDQDPHRSGPFSRRRNIAAKKDSNASNKFGL